ncbi:MAG TPA: AMP-binding protein, partial [Aquabacterium sp.]|nr:AMP-binding protein [Aquabacterium sp.]
MTQNVAHPALRRQTLSDLLHRTAKRLPNKPGILCGSTAWTWAEFDAVVSRLAAGLHAQGVAQGEHVGVLSRNSHGFAALRFALARLGAVMVPVNFMLNADEAAYILRHAGVKLLAVDSGLHALGQDAAKRDTQISRFLWLPSEDPSNCPAGCLDFNQLITTDLAAHPCPEPGFNSHHLLQIVY